MGFVVDEEVGHETGRSDVGRLWPGKEKNFLTAPLLLLTRLIVQGNVQRSTTEKVGGGGRTHDHAVKTMARAPRRALLHRSVIQIFVVSLYSKAGPATKGACRLTRLRGPRPRIRPPLSPPLSGRHRWRSIYWIQTTSYQWSLACPLWQPLITSVYTT
jgi:hypothetical protein